MNRRERKKVETRSNIIDCAVALFKEQGFQKSTMEDIAEKADVSKGTLYNYFQDKESILIAYFQTTIADTGQEFRLTLKNEQGIKEKLSTFLDFINQIIGNEIELAEIYFRYRTQTLLVSDPFDNPQRSGLENYLLEIMKEAQEHNELRGDLPALVLARNFQFLARGYFMTNMYSKEPLEMNHLKDQLIDIFLDGAKLG
jgi:AcrR family transcriptional regulator